MKSLGAVRPLSAGLTAVLLVAMYVAGQGCFWRRRTAARQEAAPLADVTLRVINHNYLDVAVYLMHDGQRTRIGTVTGSSSVDITVPPRLLGQAHEIQLYGHAIGSEDYALTERLLVQPGQYIEWTLETDLRRSSVGVY